MDLLGWLDANSGAIAGISSLVLTVITACYAYLTWRLLKESQEMRLAAARPELAIYTTPSESGGFGGGSTPLASWVLGVQGNLSLAALALSFLLVWQDAAWALPALWLLLLGHSFYMLGGLAFPPFRTTGLIYQVGGLVALWPGGLPLVAFAVATAAGSLWMGISIWREHGDQT